ncbi:tyrosine-type recombinase/integrase [Mycobacterium paraterrae]|uniref:Site-specific integrase n=1 Tax=Mycobacterium paraterrae TaxID=577492 RepID=A0ABY3VL15_9MYCO|nr:site-specific integrase [Mycobacterium paraterrae]UMB70105.1 site-specific integrase [Mycobacterium paraterrae]
MQRRNRRAGVEDRWRRADGKPTARAGKGRRWLARFVDDQGREHSKSYDLKVEAKRWLDEITASHVTGTYVTPKAGRITVAELHREWGDTQSHLKATTASTRGYTWPAHVELRWGPVPVADIQPTAVKTWVQDLVNSGAGPATIENSMGILRQVLEMAVEDRRIARNPCAGVKLPRRLHRPRGYLTHQQVELLALATGCSATVVRFLAYTGLRWGEMAALHARDTDMSRQRVHVREAVAEVRGELVWSTPKSHERRTVPFPTFLNEELNILLADKGRDDLVFTAPEGGVLRVSLWRPRVFNKALKHVVSEVAEFPSVTPRDLRHTAASLAISAGANVKAVQTMLGHASAVLTLDTYADLFPDDLERVATALDVARAKSLEATADQLRTGENRRP